jgi:Tfp pilus assembly protein PilF
MTTGFRASSNAQLQRYLRDVEAALRSNDMAKATRLSDEAVAMGFEHSNLLVLAAHHQLGAGAADRALAIAMRARAASPRNVDVLNVLGLSLTALKRGREAIAAYDAALRQSPTTVAVRFNRACTLEDLHELARARTEYERILEQQPTHAGALARLAHLAVQRGDLGVARALAGRTLQQDANQQAAHLAIAQADVEEKKFGEALARLQPLTRSADIGAVNLSIAQGLTGDALEGLGRTADAFAAYSASQAALRAYYEPTFRASGAESARNRVTRLTGYFETDAALRWCNTVDDYDSPVRGHIFLVGFPRSGTTLLEQVFAGHPDVESMEERDCLIDAANDFILPADGLDRLSALEAAELKRYRNDYWQRAAAEGASLAKPIYLDKMPLNSVLLGVVAKLFPRAKILFALRDPRDVVLSCFRRRFVITPQMFELTTLEGAADYYVAVMRLCEAYRRTLNLELLDTRYEDLVTDFDAQCRRLCAFVQLDWTESMRGFADRARAGLIGTPSAPQVARGLFTQGIGQWRKYRNELAPVLPELAPWVARFGYSAD